MLVSISVTQPAAGSVMGHITRVDKARRVIIKLEYIFKAFNVGVTATI